MSPHPPSVLPVSLLRWSLVSRLGVAVVATVALWGAIFFAWWFSIGLVLSGLVLVCWFWPRESELREHLLREERA